MSLEHWEREQRKARHTFAAEMGRLLRDEFGEVPFPHQSLSEMDPLQRAALDSELETERARGVSVNELDLPKRILNLLKRNNVTTTGDLLNLGIRIAAINGVGLKTSRSIAEALMRKGFRHDSMATMGMRDITEQKRIAKRI